MPADLTNPIFTNEDAAREHFEKLRWPDGNPICPHCSVIDEATKLGGKSHRPGLYQCNACRGAYTIRNGSIFERSHIPMHKWALAFHLMAASKKGMSAHQLHRMLGITYKSAWFMCHRIREAMRDTSTTPMGGEGQSVQVDETYFGNTSKRAKHYRKEKRAKQQIVALVEPGVKVRGFHVKTANAQVVRNIVVTNISRKSTLTTDDAYLYRKMGKEFADHTTVKHSHREYVNADGFHTNNVENFFGIFKRGMVGVYHKCDEQHLQRYVDEFSFRYSNRKVSDVERAVLAIKGAEGKRLMYR